jgi:hypothetical protein
MTTGTYTDFRPDWRDKIRQRTNAVLAVLLGAIITVGRATVRPTVNHLADHAYSIIGLGLISAAAFVHSTFTGLMVTGILFLVFEWKVSD